MLGRQARHREAGRANRRAGCCVLHATTSPGIFASPQATLSTIMGQVAPHLSLFPTATSPSPPPEHQPQHESQARAHQSAHGKLLHLTKRDKLRAFTREL